ncbi:uncharacterized protein LOC108675158 isoform X2 [Hyalella azteca]|uniref:Uncharacterized protein LOC108675158 isoform X2 n=1 Tax=Hyalella azteca TaxID=294128 RepID=A0A979FGG0_HYAAZ|nr:uncharacterized protein LOC108675158 isoform X2 [Hyalella azteca]
MEILRRLKLKPAVYSKLSEIEAKLVAVVNKCRSLKVPSNPHNLLPDGQLWTVTNSDDQGGRAVRSLLNNRKPSRLVVMSLHTDPIPQLGELLERIVANDTGDLSLVDLSYFWRFWLSSLYGSPYNVFNYMRQRQREPRMFGLRFEDSRALDYCIENELPACEDVCCVQGVPHDLGTRLKDLGWKISRWHFPHLRNCDLDWVCKILEPFKDCSFSLVIPSDRLTGSGSRRLVEMVPNAKYIYCDPRPKLPTSSSSQTSTSTEDAVPQGCLSRAKFTELTTDIILQWVNNAASE